VCGQRYGILFFVLAFYLTTIMAGGFAMISFAQSPATPADSETHGGFSRLTPAVQCSYMPSPPYTKEARDAKFQGAVFVGGTVMVDGRVTDLKIFKSPGMELDDVVLNTLRTWKCIPATHDGKQVPTKVVFKIDFRLNSMNALPTTPILKIAILADGRIMVDGSPATIDSLRLSLKRLAQQKGKVYYYREASQNKAPPEATEVIQAVIENRLPVRLSSGPDFSDAIGPDGEPIVNGPGPD
jgi:TonB family protein